MHCVQQKYLAGTDDLYLLKSFKGPNKCHEIATLSIIVLANYDDWLVRKKIQKLADVSRKCQPLSTIFAYL